MKRLLVITFIAAVVAMACNETDAGDTKAGPTSTETAAADDPATYTSIEWIDSVKSFGKINEGQQLQVSFRFKNTGDKPLVIRSVRPSCGCTAPDPPTKPIPPGEEGTINANFNSQGRLGLNNKEIYVDANTKGTTSHTLHFDVEVVKADNTLKK